MRHPDRCIREVKGLPRGEEKPRIEFKSRLAHSGGDLRRETMTQYKNVSVHEYTSGPKEGERFLKFGKGEASGSDIQLPTPNNDVEMMERMERERVLVWSLPEPMSKQETKEFLEEEKPDAVWTELEIEEEAEA